MWAGREPGHNLLCVSVFSTGYGERGAPPKIPGNTRNTLSHRSPSVPGPSLITLLPPGGASLLFEVELLKIERRSEL